MSPSPVRWIRIVWIVLGSLSLAVGFIGIFLPILPTTPFLLLTAVCYARGSPKLHAWLLSDPRFGPPIRDWQEHRLIRKRVKWTVTALMSVSFSFPLFIIPNIPLAARIAMAVIGVSVLVFIWLQKSD